MTAANPDFEQHDVIGAFVGLIGPPLLGLGVACYFYVGSGMPQVTGVCA